jgi:hypothetical protein
LLSEQDSAAARESEIAGNFRQELGPGTAKRIDEQRERKEFDRMTRFRDDLGTRRSRQTHSPDYRAMTEHGEDDLPEPSHGARRHCLTSELRETFERKGEALVLREILSYHAFEKQQAAVDWLQEKRQARDRRDVVQFWSILVPAVVAAVAAVIAAWPIVR